MQSNSFINITQNIVRRRIMLMIGLIFIFLFNATFFFITYIYKGNDMIFAIIDGAIVGLLLVYLIFYIAFAKNQMFTSVYRVGRLITLAPVVFFLGLSVYFFLVYKLVNYEYIAYAVLSFALELLVFRFNLKDKNPLKVNFKCIIFGIIAILSVPVLVIAASLSSVEVSVTDMTRTVKYELNEDDSLTIVGVYNGLASKVEIRNTYYTQNVTRVGNNAFKDNSLLKEAHVSDGITSVGAYAFSGIEDVYVDGKPRLETNSMAGVQRLHLCNSNELVSVEDNFFDGEYIEADRNLVDDYHNLLKNSNATIQPQVNADEVFITFETTEYGYINTYIGKKGSVVSYDVLNTGTENASLIYAQSSKYTASNSYYEEQYNKGNYVIPRWVNTKTNETFEFGKALDSSIIIKPVVETIYKYSVKNQLGSSQDKNMYVSDSFSQDLPTIQTMPRQGFSKLEYYYNGSKVTTLTSANKGGEVKAAWTMNTPVVESITGTTDFVLDRVYEANTTTTLTPVASHALDVEYTYSWKLGTSTESADTIDIKNVSQSGKYTLSCTATITLFDVTYTQTVTKNFDVTISRATPVLEATAITATYDAKKHEITDAAITTGEETPISIVYAGTTTANADYASSETAPKNAGSYVATISIGQTDNYTALTIERDVTIEQRKVDVTLYSDLTNVYAGSSKAALDSRYLDNEVESIETATDNHGLIAGESLSITLSGVNLTNSRYSVGSYTVAAKCGNMNYAMTVTNPTAQYTITKLATTLVATGETITYGDVTELKATNSAILVEDLSLYHLGLYVDFGNVDNSNVDAEKENATYGYYQVGSYTIGYKADPILSQNYTVTYTPAVYSIEKRVISVSTQTSALTYTAKEQIYAVILSGTAASHSITNVATVTGNKNTNAGDYQFNVVVNSGYDDNYEIGTYNADYSIAKLDATVTAAARSFTYGAALSLIYSTNTILDADKEGASLHIYEEESFVNEVTEGAGHGYIPVGTFYIGLVTSSEIDNNYNITYTSANYSVAKKAVSVSLASNQLVYNGLEQTKNTTVNNLLTNHSVGDVFTITGNKATDADSYTITFAFNDDYADFYTLTQKTYSWTIGKTSLTVTADSATITYGDSFTNGVTYNGFVNGETELDLTGTVAYSKTYSQYENAGSYIITPSGLSSKNYDITFKAGKLTVAKKTLTVTANSGNITYGESFTNGVTYNGFVGTETEAVLGGALEFSTSYAQYDDAKTYTIQPSGLTSDNYSILYNTGTLVVNKKDLTITAASDTITYGDASTTGWTGTGYVGSDSSTTITGTPVYTYKNSSGISKTGTLAVDTYSVNVSGLSAKNYTITYVAGSMSVVKKDLTVAFKNQTITYGNKVTTPVTYDGFITGESASSLGGTLAVAFTGDGTGDLSTVLAVGTYTGTPSGLTSKNYEITFTPGTLTVEKAALTVAFKTQSINYGSKVTAGNEVTYSGFKNNDTNASLGGTLEVAFTGDTNGDLSTLLPAGSYTATPSGLTSDNYTITFTPGVLTVNKVQLTVTAADVNTTYNSSFTPSYNITGFVNEEDEAVLGGSVSYTYKQNNQIASPVNAGIYSIVPSGLTSSNYSFKYVNGTLTIAQASNSFESTTAVADSTYGDAKTSAQATATYGTVNITYKNSANEAVELSATLPAGTYKACYTVEETANYAGLSKTVDFTVAKKTATLSIANKSIKAGESFDIQSLLTLNDVLESDKASFTLVIDGQGTDTSTLAVDTYTIKVATADTANYDITTTITATLTVTE